MICVLALDLGNSRLKWASATLGEHRFEPGSSGECDYDALDDLLAIWEEIDFDVVYLACVAGARRLAALKKLLVLAHERGALSRERRVARGIDRETEPGDDLDSILEVVELHSQASWNGLQNGYDEPAQLGADRWAQLIAVHESLPGQDCMIVSCGTATTIDYLRADGRFVGGLIVPGVGLMRRSLNEGTANLPLESGQMVQLATNTRDAIWSGSLHAHSAVIKEMFTKIKGLAPSAQCVLTGGHAQDLIAVLSGMPEMSELIHMEHNLVVRGLFAVARDRLNGE